MTFTYGTLDIMGAVKFKGILFFMGLPCLLLFFNIQIRHLYANIPAQKISLQENINSNDILLILA